ncbi:MAG: T9SS type A sorting domain-containing protein, partial [Armatimonadetes bacterium]|nr:T9SS type A sorting domain-containing protein [Armatimonadota bacterium]
AVYLSRRNTRGGWDLERWKTADGGATWRTTPIAAGGTEKNLRPVVPEGIPPGRKMVLWMSGRYDYFQNNVTTDTYNYDTAVQIWFEHELGGTPTVDHPRDQDLARCTPNPSSGSVAISFDLPDRSTVRLSVYDLSGRRVAELLGPQNRVAGSHSLVWNGNDSTGQAVGSGVYFVRLDVGGRVSTSKVVIVR